jgi:aryl-alcohol dehydrogenase-like predicted oxidoreductase
MRSPYGPGALHLLEQACAAGWVGVESFGGIMDIVDFGSTGLRVSRLSFGTGTAGWGGRSEQTDLGVERLANLMRLAYDHGVNFLDAADEYGSHPHVARVLQGIPRDGVVIATKTYSRTGQAVTRDVERFLMELGVDVLDVVLLHFMTIRDWPQRYAGAMEALSRAKEQGKVRAVGVSCHGLGPLRTAADSDWAEVVLARINYRGVRMEGSPAEAAPLLERMVASGKAVWGMKVLGCGQLVQDARAAIEYVFQLGTVHAITIGMSKSEHVYENLKLVEEIAPRYPLRTFHPE